MRSFLFEQVEEIPAAIKEDFRTIIASGLTEAQDLWKDSQDPEKQELSNSVNDIERVIRRHMNDALSAMLFVLSADESSCREVLSVYESELEKLATELTDTFGEEVAKRIRISDKLSEWREEWLELLFDVISDIEFRATAISPSPYTSDGKPIVFGYPVH